MSSTNLLSKSSPTTARPTVDPSNCLIRSSLEPRPTPPSSDITSTISTMQCTSVPTTEYSQQCTSVSATEYEYSQQVITAKKTLTFYPVSINTPQTIPAGASIASDTLTTAFRTFAEENMIIPDPVIQSLVIAKIWYQLDRLTVEFTDIKQVKTVFKYVKNLPHGFQVSPFIPGVLSELYSQLQDQAYHIRNGAIHHKTVIKYVGNTLALFVRPVNTSIWKPAPKQPIPASPRIVDSTPKNSQSSTMS